MNLKYMNKHTAHMVIPIELSAQVGFDMGTHIRREIARNISHSIASQLEGKKISTKAEMWPPQIRYSATVYTTTPEDFQRAVEEEVNKRVEERFDREVEARLKKAVDKEIKLRRVAADFVMKHGYAPPTNINNPKEHHFD